MKEEAPAMNDLRYLTGKEGFITEDTKRWQSKVKDNCKFKVDIEHPLYFIDKATNYIEHSDFCDLTKKGCSYSYCPTLELLKTINPRGWSNG